MHQQYLTENTPQAGEMRGRVRELLHSSEPSHVELAVQLLTGGGTHQELRTSLIVAALFSASPLSQQLLQMVEPLVSPALMHYLWLKVREQRVKKKYDHEGALQDHWRPLFSYPEINRRELALLLLQKTGLGYSFCLHEQAMPVKDLLAKQILHQQMTLYHFRLSALPKEIALFPQLTRLDIRGNYFTELPDEIGALRLLQEVYCDKNQLSPQAMEKLDQLCPRVKAYRLASQAHTFIENDAKRDYHRALSLLDEALSLDPGFTYVLHIRASALRGLGRKDEALQSHIRALELEPERAIAWTNKTYSLIDMGYYQEALSTIQQAFDKLSQENNYTYSLWDYMGRVLYHLRRFDEAHEAFDKALQIKPGYGYIRYHKAKVYASQGKKPEMLATLEEAFQDSPALKKNVAAEACFVPYLVSIEQMER